MPNPITSALNGTLYGGRPRGVLNKITLMKQKREADMQKIYLQQTKKLAREKIRIALGGEKEKDRSDAIEHVFDRTFGQSVKNINANVSVFSLKSLNELRKDIKTEAIDITDKTAENDDVIITPDI